MKNADKFVVGGQVYDVLSPATFGDYMETIGSACINPDGYAENKLFLAYDDNVQKLFRATTAIAYSEILIKDTNCEPTTMAEALANALSAGGVSYDNSDSGLTASNVQGAIDEVNGNVETVNSDLANEVATRVANGAHNLLKNTASSVTNNGVTFIVNTDGTVTASTGSGGATATTTLTVINDMAVEVGKKYILSGCPSGGGLSTYELQTYEQSTTYRDFGGSVEFVTDAAKLDVSLVVRSGAVLTTPIIFKPMLRLATDTDPTYQPYAMTNRELTEALLVTRVVNFTPPTIPANSVGDKTITAKLDGYSLLGVVSEKLNGGGQSGLISWAIQDYVGGVVFLRYVNNTSNAISPDDGWVRLIYIKSEYYRSLPNFNSTT